MTVITQLLLWDKLLSSVISYGNNSRKRAALRLTDTSSNSRGGFPLTRELTVLRICFIKAILTMMGKDTMSLLN